MLTELCQYLHNWFDRNQPKWYGVFTITADGNISADGAGLDLKEGQYIRVLGSTFNDGVHLCPAFDVVPEEFEGAIWAMAVPPAVIALAEKIQKWNEKYGDIDSVAMSPYTSESFGGYSYSKNAAGGVDGVGTWRSVFAGELNPWRKLP